MLRGLKFWSGLRRPAAGGGARDAIRGGAAEGSRVGPWYARSGLIVLVVALAVRLVYLIGYRTNPFFADPQMDALFHHRWALQIAKGDWLGSEPFFRAPLYPWFLGAVYAITGNSFVMARIVQAVIGSFSCVLVMRIGRRLYGPGTGLVAGLLAALLGPSVYYEAELLLVVLETFLGLLALDLLTALIDAEWRPGAVGRTLGAGLALGLAAITRPNFLVLVPVALAWLVYRLRRFGRAVWAVALLLYVGGVAGPVLLVTLRNYAVGEDFVLIASQGGLNFYLGNNPSADGMAALAPEFRQNWYGGVRDATRLAEEAMGRPLKPSEVSDYWSARGTSWIRQHPDDWFRLFRRKIDYFWGAFEIPNNEDFYFFSRYSFLFRSPLLLTFGAVAPLALAGFGLAALRRRTPGLLLSCAVAYSLSIVAFFVCGRFRAPITPMLCVPAAWFLVESLDDVRHRRWRPFLPAVLLLVVAFWYVHRDPAHLHRRHTVAESWLRLGVLHSSRGRIAEAEAAYRSAIAAEPGFEEGHNNLGVLLMNQNRSPEALAEFEAALRINPEFPRTLNNMAAWYEREGDLDRAREYVDRSLAIKADDVEVRYNAGVIYGRLGDFAGSAGHFRRLLELEPSHLAGRLGLGKSLLMEEKFLEAAQAFAQVVERDPRHVEALYFLGMARVRMNDLAGARRAWEECLKVRPDYEPAGRQLRSLRALPPSLRPGS